MQFESSLTILNSNTPLLLEKRIKLLVAIKNEGSISKAAKTVPMSYKTAWEAIDSINNLCPTLVVKKEIGGIGGGGAILTPYGENLINTYNILKSEHEKFLENITKLTDFNTGNLKSLQRITMKISARNQLNARIKDITFDNVSALICLETLSGQELFANISKNSIENLDLKIINDVIAIFKSNNVMISTSENIGLSARNKIKGTVLELNFSEVNCEVIINIGQNQTITSVITKTSAVELKLSIGCNVIAVIKSSDIMIGI